MDASKLEGFPDIHCPFKQAYSRALTGPTPVLDRVFDGNPISQQDISEIETHLHQTRSTTDDLRSWLDKDSHLPNPPVDIVACLLSIIHRDVTGFLHFVSNILEEIRASLADEFILRRRIGHWRRLMVRLQTELPAIQASITTFIRFVYEFDLIPPQGLPQVLDDMQDQLSALIEGNQEAYRNLRAEMALLESKKGISQAESISELTELGFFFVPLTCAASMFSMQVNELSGAVPLYSFVIAAIITLSCAYFFRLVLRSSRLGQLKREQFSKIRERGDIPPGAQIPTAVFVRHIIYGVGYYEKWLPYFVFCLMVFPITLLWTHHRHLDAGFKGVITALVLCSAIIAEFSFIIWPKLQNRLLNRLKTTGNLYGYSPHPQSRVSTTTSPPEFTPSISSDSIARWWGLEKIGKLWESSRNMVAARKRFLRRRPSDIELQQQREVSTAQQRASISTGERRSNVEPHEAGQERGRSSGERPSGVETPRGLAEQDDTDSRAPP